MIQRPGLYCRLLCNASVLITDKKETKTDIDDPSSKTPVPKIPTKDKPTTTPTTTTKPTPPSTTKPTKSTKPAVAKDLTSKTGIVNTDLMKLVNDSIPMNITGPKRYNFYVSRSFQDNS